MPQFDPNRYVDVQERIDRFWRECPDGAIVTELASNPGQFDQVVFRAEVYKHRDNGRPDATGYAAEVAGSSFKDGANFTSWHENAETSAIGRALANMGYAKNRDDRPSRQEMQKVANAPPNPRPNPPQPPRVAPENRSGDPEQRLANGVRDARRVSPDAAPAATWKTFWEYARSQGVKTAVQYTELTARELPDVPEHALNLLNKTLRERDAALAGVKP